MYQSTKKFGPISTCHRNWHAANLTTRDAKKCSFIHGYSRYLQLTMSGDLDQCGWIYDFGDFKFVKEFLEDNWDHKVLIASDDPEMEFIEQMVSVGLIQVTVLDVTKGWNPGLEGSCKHVFDFVNPIIMAKTNGRVHVAQVEIWEHEFNSAIYKNDAI